MYMMTTDVCDRFPVNLLPFRWEWIKRRNNASKAGFYHGMNGFALKLPAFANKEFHFFAGRRRYCRVY